jgi:hypothetical protein
VKIPKENSTGLSFLRLVNRYCNQTNTPTTHPHHSFMDSEQMAVPSQV